MHIFYDTETVGTEEILQETLGVAQEVAEDIQKLKPNAVLETVKSCLPGLMNLGYRLLAVAVIVFIGTRIINYVQKFLSKTFERMEVELSLRKFLISLANVMMYMMLILIAADKLGINPTSVIAVIGSAGVAIALSLQESLSNFAGGIVILMMKPFKVGDYIVASGMEGTVTNIGLIYTNLLTIDNKSVVIPNGGLANSSITNVTAEKQRRLDFTVRISYESDLRKAKDILFEILDQHPFTQHEEGRMPEVVVSELGESAITLCGRAWVKTEEYWPLKFSVTESIKLQYDQAGIKIPYSQVYVTMEERASKKNTDY
ncbi:MAG: mechanosensitive ion channel family protein [Lachnospiraceae bacterium]|nr:mechanosensitive ion channel family protein [Lachnospiraceae bacterium]